MSTASGKMGTSVTHTLVTQDDACVCRDYARADSSTSMSDVNEKVRQLEARLLAKLQEAMDMSNSAAHPPSAPALVTPTTFLRDNIFGILIWSVLGNIITATLVWLVSHLSKLLEYVRALRRVWTYIRATIMSQQRLSRSDSASAVGTGTSTTSSPGVISISGGQLHDAASALAQHAASTDHVAPDIKRQECANRGLIARTIKHLCVGAAGISRRGRKDQLPTDCRTLAEMSTAGAGSCSPIDSTAHESPGTFPSAPLPDATNMAISINMLLPNTPFEALSAGGDHMKSLRTQAEQFIPAHAHDTIRVEPGSTFLSATVPVARSAIEGLLHCAVCFLKLGASLDAACSVELGHAAVLYMGGDNTPRIKLLKEGREDMPIIATARLYRNRIILIEGYYLEDVEVKAINPNCEMSITLHVLYHEKLEDGSEMLMAEGEALNKDTRIYVAKTITREDEPLPWILRSESKQLEIVTPRVLIIDTLRKRRFWLCFLVLCIYQVVVLQPLRFHVGLFMLQVIVCFGSSCLVEHIIGPWAFEVITRCIESWMRRRFLSSISNVSSPNNEDVLVPHLENNISSSRQEAQRIESETGSSSDDQGYNSENEIAKLVYGFQGLLSESSNNDASIHTTVSESNLKIGPVTDIDWEWPCFERFLHKGRWVIKPASCKPVQMESVQECPFEVVTTVERDGSEIVELILRSPLLIGVLKDCPPKTRIQFVKGSRIDPREIFLRRKSLQSYIVNNSDHSTKNQVVLYVNHLLRFVNTHFTETIVQHERMETEGCVSFDMLWAFFIPGEGVCRRCLVTNQECFATVRYPAIQKTSSQGTFYSIILNVMDFNVQSYYRCKIEYKIAPFDGEVPFTALSVCPLQFFSNRKQMEARFVSMGNLFYRVAMQQQFRFMQFMGPMNFYEEINGCLALRKLNSDGRVMIDLLSFARMNPDYPLGNAEPPCEVMIGMWSPEGQMKRPTDEELILAPAFAYGFSFRLKKWGCFEICGLRDIHFNQGAFGELKMKNESQKMILWSVVQHYVVGNGSGSPSDQSIDPIASKGTGCIVLCHGPPGTGKTLTAEALAETMQCPLWSISAFELGDEPKMVEAMLRQIMEIAHKWRAILLLDEADAYLERRDEGVDVKRNMLTGVFLRVLEYYCGIMFLTTNRVTAFDDAILSRTTLAISYPALDDAQRREIWKNLLARVGVQSNITYDALLHHDLNGRQIRNIVHLAQLLAHDRKQSIQITHVLEAMDAFISGTTNLP